MSQADSSAPRPNAFVPFVLTFGMTIVNVGLIAAGGICAVQPGLATPGLWIGLAAIAVVALSLMNWLVLIRYALVAPLGQVARAAGGALLPLLLAGPMFQNGGIFHDMQIAAALPLLIAMFCAILPPTSAVLAHFMTRVVGTDRAAVYRPILASELPAAVREFFAERTAALDRMGFRLVGDYRVKEGMHQFSRLFSRADGKVSVAVEVTRMGLLTEFKSTSFMTVLENGCYIETGNVALPKRTPNVHDVIILQSLPKGTDTERLAAHETMVSEASLARCSAPREVFADELPALCRYGMKLLYDRMVREGEVTSSPYDNRDEALFRPEAAPVLAH